MIDNTTQHYTRAQLFSMAQAGEVGKLVTLVLTLQRRAAQLEEQARVLEVAGGASVIRNIEQCPTCGRQDSMLINGGRARRCQRCRRVWSL